jgi:hypothetical protein
MNYINYTIRNNQINIQQINLFIGFIDAMGKNLSIASHELIFFFGKKRNDLFRSISSKSDNLNKLYNSINNFYFIKTTNLRKFIESFKIDVDNMTAIKDEKFNYKLFMELLSKNLPVEYDKPDIDQLKSEINKIKEDIKKQLQMEVANEPPDVNNNYNLQNPDNIKRNLMQLYATQCYIKCFNIMNLFDNLGSSLNYGERLTIPDDEQFVELGDKFLGGTRDIEMTNVQNNQKSTFRRDQKSTFRHIGNNIEIIKSLNDLQYFYAENGNFKQYSQNVLMKLIKPTDETFVNDTNNDAYSFVERLFEILKNDDDVIDLLGINAKIFEYAKSNNVQNIDYDEFIKLIKYNDDDSTNLIKLASERLNYQIYEASDGSVKKLSNLEYPSKYIFLKTYKSVLNCSELPIEVQNHEYCYTDIANTDIANTDIANTDIANTDIANTDIANTDIANTDIANTDIANTDIVTGGAIPTRSNKVYGIVVDLILHQGENPSAIEKQNYKCQYSFNELSNEYCKIFGVGCSNKIKKGGKKTMNTKYYKQLTKFNNLKTRKNI